MSLEQHVHQPTHEKGHTLDLIITRSPDTMISSIPAADELFSDHFSVSCSLSFPKPHLSSKIVTLCSKDLDLSLFLEDLSSSNLFTNPPEHPDDLLQSYNTTLRAVYDHHAPIRQKTITTRCRVPWFNNTIKRAIQCRRKAERKWRFSAKPDDLAVFKEERNITTSLMNQERHSFYSDWIGQSHIDQRQLFRKAKTLLGLDSKHSLPPHSCPAEL